MSEAAASSPNWAEKYTGKLCTAGLTIVGVTAALAALSGPLSQTDLMGYSEGFVILRWSIYVMGVGAAICLLGFIAGIIAYKGNVLSYAAPALIGLIISAAVFWVPYSQLRRGAPPIHEVTTDFDNPPAFVAVVPLREAWGAVNPPEYVGMIQRGERSFNVTQMQKDNYPDIQPLVLDSVSMDMAYERALKGVNDMNWTVVEANPQAGTIEAYDKTAWFGFIDDVSIRLTDMEGAVKIDVRSKSRVGFGDVGANAKRVRDYLRKVSGRSAHG